MVKSYASAVCIVKLTWTSCCRTVEGSPVPRLCPGDWALPRGRLGWGLPIIWQFKHTLGVSQAALYLQRTSGHAVLVQTYPGLSM
jgi:hypothetical protein